MIKFETLRFIPKWVSFVESKTGVNNHGNPKGNKDDKNNYVSAFPVMLYYPISTHMDSTRRTPHFEDCIYLLTQFNKREM
jgi:hypothetical protein